MKSLAIFSAAVVLGLSLAVTDADAASRRLGSGKSMGMQREAVSPQKSYNAQPAPQHNQAAAPSNAQQPAHAPAAAQAPAAQPKRSWMGPLAGLAAGIGLAALASHFGFGEELASMMMIGLLIMAVMVVVGLIMRRKAGAQKSALADGGLQYAGAGNAPYGRAEPQAFQPVYGGSSAAPASQGSGGNIPADFDVAGFVRNAKVNFLRLQAANDAGNLDDIREFTTPEMFAEIRMEISERGGEKQETNVLVLEADVLDVAEEGNRHIVSVRFHGTLRETGNAMDESFDEIWHLVKPTDGSRGWVIAGIQQLQ